VLPLVHIGRWFVPMSCTSTHEEPRLRIDRRRTGSLPDLQAAINRFVAETNKNPKPFVWTADPDKVLAAVKRGKQALESIH